MRDLAGSVLKRGGYAVLTACDGEEALRLSKNHAGEIHLMITDDIMPGMRGHELAEVMRNLRPQIKVLFISGYTDDAAIHQGVLVEGIQFLQKPFTPDALAHKARSVLDRGECSLESTMHAGNFSSYGGASNPLVPDVCLRKSLSCTV